MSDLRAEFEMWAKRYPFLWLDEVSQAAAWKGYQAGASQEPPKPAAAPDWDIWSDIFLRLNAMEAMHGRTGPSIQLRDLLTQIRDAHTNLQIMYATAWTRLQQLKQSGESA